MIQIIPRTMGQKGTRSRIRNTAKSFLKIRIRGSVILKYGSGSGRPIIYRSRTYLDILVAIWKKYVLKYYQTLLKCFKY
jgi:hypothetical protein